MNNQVVDRLNHISRMIALAGRFASEGQMNSAKLWRQLHMFKCGELPGIIAQK